MDRQRWDMSSPSVPAVVTPNCLSMVCGTVSELPIFRISPSSIRNQGEAIPQRRHTGGLVIGKSPLVSRPVKRNRFVELGWHPKGGNPGLQLSDLRGPLCRTP